MCTYLLQTIHRFSQALAKGAPFAAEHFKKLWGVEIQTSNEERLQVQCGDSFELLINLKYTE